jgi:hypothetical protein
MKSGTDTTLKLVYIHSYWRSLSQALICITPRSITLTAGPTLMFQQPPSFSKSPTLALPGLLKRLPQVSHRSNFDVQQEWSGTVAPSAWHVKGEDLEMVPVDFPLERSHRTIHRADAPMVSLRIAKCLRSMSIDAEYDCKAAKAKCSTSDLVSFRIRLFASGENGLPVVVEIQKRSGSSSSFMRTCRAIFNAAENNKEAVCTPKKMPLKPIGQMKCLQSVLSSFDYESEAASSMDSAIDMLRSTNGDSNILGLENLGCLSDAFKTNDKVALQVSKWIILDDEKNDLREEIRLLTERDIFSAEEHTDALARHAKNLRHLALIVLANALALCSKDGSLAAAVQEQSWFFDYLIPSLVDNLKRVESSACNAYQAACGLHSLISCSPSTRGLLLTNGSISVFEESYAFGDKRHALLADETRRCLTALNVSRA